MLEDILLSHQRMRVEIPDPCYKYQNFEIISYFLSIVAFIKVPKSKFPICLQKINKSKKY